MRIHVLCICFTSGCTCLLPLYYTFSKTDGYKKPCHYKLSNVSFKVQEVMPPMGGRNHCKPTKDRKLREPRNRNVKTDIEKMRSEPATSPCPRTLSATTGRNPTDPHKVETRRTMPPPQGPPRGPAFQNPQQAHQHYATKACSIFLGKMRPSSP